MKSSAARKQHLPNVKTAAYYSWLLSHFNLTKQLHYIEFQPHLFVFLTDSVVGELSFITSFVEIPADRFPS